MTSRRGFLLMEVLPAVALLSVIFAVAGRMWWTALVYRRAAELARLREAALPLVCRQWITHPDHLVLATPDPGGWSFRYFPETGWLPESVGEALLFRRTPVTGPGGQALWEVACRGGQGASGNRWRVMGQVLRPVADGGGIP